MDATDAYIVGESIGLKSIITWRPTKTTPMMTKAVTQNQEKILTKRRCTGTRSRKRNMLDLKFMNTFFSYSLLLLFLGPSIEISGPANAPNPLGSIWLCAQLAA